MSIEPNRAELLGMLKDMLIDAEETAWGGFSIHSDDDAIWRVRLEQECKSWFDLITRCRRTLKASNVLVPTPLEIRENERRRREEQRQREAAERKQRLDAKRCRSCGRAKGHTAACAKAKK